LILRSSSPLSESKGLHPPSPFDFARFFLRSGKIGKSFGVDVVYSSGISPMPVTSSCPAGNDAVIISPDGRISNCYQLPEKWKSAGFDLDIGMIKVNGEIHIEKKKVEAVRKMVASKPGCAGCFCRWSCAGGCHVGHSSNGLLPGYDDFCIQTRIISAFSLLNDLNPDMNPEILMNDMTALNKLAVHPSDLLNDFR
jgi:radical SAM protein with 4Fe4S-binding SPASM domain